MGRTSRLAGAIVVALLFADAAPLEAGHIANDHRRGVVTVRVYDTIALPADVIHALRTTAESALAGAFALRWLNCTLSEGRDAECDDERTSRDVVVRIMHEHAASARSACGFALPSLSARGFISLAYRCAQAAAGRGAARDRVKPTPAQILGYVLAHELAHVLLPGVPHSDAGLFSARLGRKHWQRHQQGGLGFAPGDVARLREAAR